MDVKCIICHKNIESDLKILSIGEAHGNCWYFSEELQQEVNTYIPHSHKVCAILYNRNNESKVIDFINGVDGWSCEKDTSFFLIHIYHNNIMRTHKVLTEGDFIVWDGFDMTIMKPEKFYSMYKY